MEEDYEYLGQFYDDWEDYRETRVDEVDKRLQHADGYIDPRTYDSYDIYHLNWLKLKEDLDREDDLESEQWEELMNRHPVVGNIDIKKLEELPYHEKIWHKDGYKKYHYRYPVQLQTAIKIFKGSVGKNMSDIKKRMDPLLKSGTESFKTFTDWYLEADYRRWGRTRLPDYFVDENNILRSRIEPKPRKKRPITWQQHYAYQQKRRDDKKRWKNQNKKSLIVLAMINNPALLNFYLRSSSELDGLIRKKAEWEEYAANPSEVRRIKKGTSKWWFSPNKFLQQDKRKLAELSRIVPELERGIYDSYYRSPNYLFSIGKECPHFAQP